MKNFVGREIPDELLVNGKEVFQGINYRDGQYFKKASPKVRIYEKPVESKVVGSIREAILKCNMRDGMTVSFHHHFRDGDYVVNMVMKEIVDLGLKILQLPLPVWVLPMIRWLNS